MPTRPVVTALRSLARDPDPRPDGELVGRFAADRDGESFAELVRRHGPLVFGVCRRVLGHTHDAEDAFQAVWLVLARRAGDVRPPGSVGPWLYGVAVRTATKARALAMKRRQRQLAAARPEAVADRPAADDLWPVLDEELARLPESYRRAVVACDLGGRSRSAAARDLGWPEGTVAARLAKARELLAARLRRRGVTLSAAGLAAVLASEAARAEPTAGLAADSIAAALAFAGGSASAVPPVSRALAEGVMRAMTVGRWKLPAVVLMAAGLAGGLAAGALVTANADPPALPRGPYPAEPVGAGGAGWKEGAVLDHPGWLVGSVAYSPDGRTLYAGGTDGHVRAWDAGAGKPRWSTEVGGKFAAVAVSADGKTLAATVPGGVRLLDAADGKLGKTLKVNSDPRAVAWSPDGKWVATSDGTAIGFRALDDSGGSAGITAQVTGNHPAAVAWAPDSLYLIYPYPTGEGGSGLVGMMGVTPDAKPRNVDTPTGPVSAVAWSKDGKVFASGGADGTVILWDAATHKEKSRLALGGRVAALALTADGGRVAAAVINRPLNMDRPSYNEDVFVWPTGNPPAELTPLSRQFAAGTFDGTASVTFSPDGKSLAAAFCNNNHLNRLGELVGKVRVWTLAGAEKPAADRGGPVHLTEHEDLIDGVAYAPDGRTFATGGGGTVILWDAATHKPLWKFRPDTPGVTAVAFSPDGKLVAATHANGVTLLDAATGKPALEIEERDSNPSAVAFGTAKPVQNLKLNRLAFTNGRTVWAKTWIDGGPVGGSQFGPLAGGGGVNPNAVPAGVAYSPDGEELVFIPNAKIDPDWVNGKTGGQMDPKKATQYFAQVWGGGSGKPMRFLPEGFGAVTAVAWSRDGKQIATGGADGSVILWDAGTGKESHRFGTGKNTVHALAFSPDGKTLAVAADIGIGAIAGQVLLIDTDRGVLTRQEFRDFHKTPPAALAFSPDGKTLLAGCGSHNPDVRKKPAEERKQLGEVQVLAVPAAPAPDAAKPAGPAAQVWKERELKPDASDPYQGKAPFDAAAFAPDGSAFALARGDGQVILYDAKTRGGKWGYRASEKTATGLSFSPDGTMLAIATPDGLRVHTDVRPHNPLDGVTGTAAAFAPDGKRIAVSDGATTRVVTVTVRTGTVTAEAGGVAMDGPPGVQKGVPAGVAWSPDGKWLALIRHEQQDGKWPVVVWGAGTGEPLKVLAGHTDRVQCVAWSKDGKTIVTGGADGQVLFWDGETFKDRNYGYRLTGRSGRSTVHALAISPDGNTAAAGYELDVRGKAEHVVALLDARTGKPVAELYHPWKSPIRSLAFSPDGDTLVATSGDGVVVWERAKE